MDPITLGLPHREPFIFVDKVHSVKPGESAACQKAFAESEPFFRGHFPGDPIVPGVLITEALAQTAGIAAGEPGKVFHLSAIKGMKFLRVVRPGDILELAAQKVGTAGALSQFQVTATVCGAIAADGVVVLSEAGGTNGGSAEK